MFLFVTYNNILLLLLLFWLLYFISNIQLLIGHSDRPAVPSDLLRDCCGRSRKWNCSANSNQNQFSKPLLWWWHKPKSFPEHKGFGFGECTDVIGLLMLLCCIARLQWAYDTLSRATSKELIIGVAFKNNELDAIKHVMLKWCVCMLFDNDFFYILSIWTIWSWWQRSLARTYCSNLLLKWCSWTLSQKYLFIPIANRNKGMGRSHWNDRDLLLMLRTIDVILSRCAKKA